MAEQDVKEVEVQYKLYHRRWFMLFMFVCFEIGNNVQWLEYSIIANLVTKYYNVPNAFVDWTSMIFMATFLPLIFPASYFLNKKVSKKFMFWLPSSGMKSFMYIIEAATERHRCSDV